jgi:hypothetical protein
LLIQKLLVCNDLIDNRPNRGTHHSVFSERFKHIYGDLGHQSTMPIDKVGNPTILLSMSNATLARPKAKAALAVVADYNVAADAKKRISLRGAKAKYFHVQALSNGSYILEPRVLVPLQAISARSLKMLEKSVAGLKQGVASAPIDLMEFLDA